MPWAMNLSDIPNGLNDLFDYADLIPGCLEAVSAFLDHSSLAVTTTYLRRLEGATDETWDKVAEAIGV